MEDGKPLEKHTVKELKEMALALGSIQGVSAMKKQELIDAIKVAKGIPLRKERDASVVTIIDVKKRIKSLKEELAVMRETRDRNASNRIRRKLSKLKKKTRRIARQIS
ncbi:MAG: Rho termination factor N-terminal domain-containing protein [Deltaproteobacteria bacterium]|nr:Rho termination factor N-terminal domain-containing protein [Deltaproteobacteria bacterium]